MSERPLTTEWFIPIGADKSLLANLTRTRINPIFVPYALLRFTGEEFFYGERAMACSFYSPRLLDPPFNNSIIEVNTLFGFQEVLPLVCAPLSTLLQRDGLGSKYEACLFLIHQDVDPTLATDLLDRVVEVANQYLSARELPPIPSIRDHLYPLNQLSW